MGSLSFGTLLKRFISESGHYYVAIGLALIGLGVYLEVASTSPDKHTFSALVFLYGAWCLGTPLWWFIVKPRLKVWWRARRQ